jgi:putative hydrolase of the HAD superfamily
MDTDAGGETDWVVFDLGGVILTDTTALPYLAARFGTDLDRFAAAYAAPRVDYDRTSDARAYWLAVAEGCDAPPPDDALVRELTRIDVEGWSDTDGATLALIGDLSRAGVRLAILSNAPAQMGDLIRTQGWAAPLEPKLFSGELGVVKPDPRIYRILLDQLASPPERVVFTDDLAGNIAAAEACGIRAVRFTSADDVRARLRQYGLHV